MKTRITLAGCALAMGTALTALTALGGCAQGSAAADPHPGSTQADASRSAASAIPAAVPDAALLPTAADLVEYGEDSSPWHAGATSTGLPKAWLRPCRGDAGVPPVRRGFLSAAARDFSDPDGAAGANPQAQAVVLDYPAPHAAGAAYADLAVAYQGCSAVLRADGARHVSPTSATAVRLGALGRGPGAARARTFMVTYDAPVDEQAITQLQHGIAVDGTRLLVVTATQDTQDYWPDLAASMPKMIERFARTTGLPRTLTVPTQVDYVRVGESYRQAMRGGDLVAVRAGGRRVYALRPYGRVTTTGGETRVAGQVCVSRPYGVEAIWMPPQVRTDKGIGIGSTAAAVRKAYHGTTEDSEGYLDYRLWGGRDATELHFGIRHGTVVAWAVAEVDQHCFD